MELHLISARPDLRVNASLREEADRRGVVLRVVDATRAAAVSGDRPGIRIEGSPLLDPPPGAVLARVGNWRPEATLALLEIYVARGIPTPNGPEAIRRGRDHWRTVLDLSRSGLPVPETVSGSDPEALAAEAVATLGLPVVVKQRRSRMGVGVIRCATRDHLEAVLDSLWRVGDEVVVQRWVETGGVSLRLLVVGGRVAAAGRFRAGAGEWRSNAARGARVEPWEPGDRERELALEAAEVLGLGVCGVDLLPGPGGVVVGEVNPTPGFAHIESATGAGVAGAVVEYLVRLAGKGSRQA